MFIPSIFGRLIWWRSVESGRTGNTCLQCMLLPPPQAHYVTIIRPERIARPQSRQRAAAAPLENRLHTKKYRNVSGNFAGPLGRASTLTRLCGRAQGPVSGHGRN